MDEQRNFVRLHAHLAASYKAIHGNEALTSVTHDVGGGGMSLFTKTKLEPGTVLEVGVQFPTRPKAIRFTARVVWSGQLIHSGPEQQSRPFETGVRFIDIAPEDRKFVMRYAAKRPPAPPATSS